MKFAFLIEPPFNYRNEQGKVTGCDVELARTVLKMIGIDKFELVETEFGELLPGLEQNRWQMTTGLFATSQRREIAAFSHPIWALPDGLLVNKNNPQQLAGYRSIANKDDCILAVIRDQFQHQTAHELGVPENRIMIFETYNDAARSVLEGLASAYASVGRAHSGYLDQNPDLDLEMVVVPKQEKEPAFGCFGFNKANNQLREAVDTILKEYIGSSDHRKMMKAFGFSHDEIDLILA